MEFAASPSVSWRILTVALVIAVSQWTSYAADLPAKCSKEPGATSPEKIEVAIGESFSITCCINATHGNRSSLWFKDGNSDEEYRQPSEHLTSNDLQSIVLTLRKTTKHMGFYICMSEVNKTGRGIDTTDVYVGTPPSPITDFACTASLLDMTCEFTPPDNVLATNYSLEYKNDKDMLSNNCSLTVVNSRTVCKLNPFFAVRYWYYFSLTGSNELGTIVQTFAISLNESTILPPINIILKELTTDSVTLYWREPNGYDAFEYEIRITPKGFQAYDVPVHPDSCSNQSCRVNANLAYPNRSYQLTARVRLKIGPLSSRTDTSTVTLNSTKEPTLMSYNITTHKQDRELMWSESCERNFTTNSRKPDTPPSVDVGSFHVNAPTNTVQLYWQELEEYEQNGPNFEYIVYEVDAEGVKRELNRTTSTSIVVTYPRSPSINYAIKSSNDDGTSTYSSLLRVYPTIANNEGYVPRAVVAAYHDRTYKLSWKPPLNDAELVNYTVFWCVSKPVLLTQCNGSLGFSTIDKTSTTFTTDSQDNSLNLAVSANYRNSSTGMHWATCSTDVSSDLKKMNPRVLPEEPTGLRVQWQLEEGVCSSIVKSYNLTYCPLADQSGSHEGCCDNTGTTVELPQDRREYVIKNLQPYTKYLVGMYMASEKKIGPVGCTEAITMETAPSAPRNLTFDRSSVTNNSVNISWLPPLELNGLIRNYTIYFWKVKASDHKDQIHVAARSDERIQFKLESLNSFSEYEVYVTAQTTSSSRPSNSIRFTTLTGVPTSPRRVIFPLDSEDGDEARISWLEPDMPSGRLDYYELQLVIETPENGTNDQYTGIVARVNGTECRFRRLKCIDGGFAYSFKVRAVNIAEGIENQTRSAEEHAVKSTPSSPDDINSIFTNFECFGAKPINKIEANRVKFYSLWQDSTKVRLYCPPPPLLLLVMSIVFPAVLCVLFFRIRNYLNKMKNIEAVLPEGLIDHLPAYGFGSGKDGYDNQIDKTSSEISRSIECLMATNKRREQNHQLLTDHSPCQDSINGFVFNSESNCSFNYDKQSKFYNSSSTESSPEHNLTSTDFVELKEQPPVGVGTKTGSDDYVAQDTVVGMPLATFNPVPTANGYVMHSAMIAALYPEANKCAIAGAPNGYVQPHAFMLAQEAPPQTQQQHQFQQMNTNGYTTLDAISKPLATAEADALPDKHNQPVPQIAANDVADDQNEGPALVKPEVSHHNNNNNINKNNTSIYGYVTQKQLAKYGQSLY